MARHRGATGIAAHGRSATCEGIVSPRRTRLRADDPRTRGQLLHPRGHLRDRHQRALAGAARVRADARQHRGQHGARDAAARADSVGSLLAYQRDTLPTVVRGYITDIREAFDLVRSAATDVTGVVVGLGKQPAPK